MNFAFVTVLLLFLSIPGIAIRRSYYAGRFSVDFITTNLINEIIWSLIPAFVLHALAVLVVEAVSDYRILLDYIGYIVAGGNDKERVALIFQNVHNNISNIIFYNTILTIVAVILGSLGRYTIRATGLDIRYEILRFPNTWHYLFTGEYLDIERGWRFYKNIDLITVDVLINTGKETVIYSGKLEDYYLKSSGGLDRIIIKFPAKKVFSADGNTEYRQIPGNYLTIPFEKIININTQYFEFDWKENGDDDIDFQENNDSNENRPDIISE